MFKDKLKELRNNKNISQYELATIIHISRTAVSKWERGIGIPSECNLEALCDYFGVSEEYLLDRNDLYQELNKREIIISNLKYHLPVIFLSFLLLLLTVVELFVFVREGIHIADSRYHPNLSILSVLQGWSLIPIGIYIIIVIFNILFIFNTWDISNKVRLVVTLSSYILIVSCYLLTFIISYNLVSPYNYGMFWKPHFTKKGGWFK